MTYWHPEEDALAPCACGCTDLDWSPESRLFAFAITAVTVTCEGCGFTLRHEGEEYDAARAWDARAAVRPLLAA